MPFRTARLRLVALAVLIHAAVALVGVSPLFFRVNVATAVRVFGGGNGPQNLFEDVRAYHEYASRAVGGEVPYRDYDIEYPIGAFPLFLLPRLVASGTVAYRWALGVEMLLIDAALCLLVARRGEETIGAGRALLWYTIGLGLLGALPFARFDFAPTALAFGAALAAEGGAGGLGGALASLGALMKVFPGLVTLPAIASRRPGWRRDLLALAGVSLAGAALWSGLGGAGMMRSLRYHSGRGLENESLWAGLLMGWGVLTGGVVGHDFNHSSVELIAPGATSLAAISPLVQLSALGWILIGCARGRREEGDALRPAAACLLAFALFGKVLSPQYVLWLLPFVATLGGTPGRSARPILILACGLTTLVYFWAGVGLVRVHPLAVALLNARNGLLVALWWVLARRPSLHGPARMPPLPYGGEGRGAAAG